MPPQGAPGGSGELGTPGVRPRSLGAQPSPRGLRRAASKVADFTAFDPPGGAQDHGGGGVGKIVDSSSTRAAIGWQPKYKTFGEFIDTLV